MEDTRSAWGWIWLEQLIRDLLRRRSREPGVQADHVDVIGLQPAGLQIGVDIGDLRHVLECSSQLLGPSL